MRAVRKKLNIHASAADLLHIRIAKLDWYNAEIAKTKREK